MARSSDTEVFKHYQTITGLLEGKTDGLSSSQLWQKIFGENCPAGDKKYRERTRARLKRYLAALVADEYSGVYFMMEGIEYGSKNNQETLEPEQLGSRKHRRYFLPKDSSLSTQQQAIAIAVINKFAQQMLPPDARESLKDYFDKNKKKLGYVTEKDTFEKSWMDKIDVVSRYPPIYPNFKDNDYTTNEKIIFDALEYKTGFHAQYLCKDERTFVPVRLRQREQIMYVICSLVDDPDNYKEYAIHRFSAISPAPKADTSTALYEESSITKIMTSGVQGEWRELEELIIEVSGSPAQHLSEIRFGASTNSKCITKAEILEYDEQNRRIPKSRKRVTKVRLTIKNINYTYELKTWLLGLGKFAKIIEPSELVHEIKSELKAMLMKY